MLQEILNDFVVCGLGKVPACVEEMLGSHICIQHPGEGPATRNGSRLRKAPSAS